MSNDNWLRCPICGNKMVSRERNSDGQPFFGCSKYPECKGIRGYDAGEGKLTLSNTSGSIEKCRRCGQYPSFGLISDMGLCPTCQEHFENE